MDDAIVLYPGPGIGHVCRKLILRRYSHRFSIIILLSTGPFDTPPLTLTTSPKPILPSLSTASPIYRLTPLLPLAISSLSSLSSSVSVPLMSSMLSSNSPKLPPFGHSSSTTFALQLFLLLVTLEFPLTTSSPPVLLLLRLSFTFRQFTNSMRAAIRASRTCPLHFYTFLGCLRYKPLECLNHGSTETTPPMMICYTSQSFCQNPMDF
ncbi:hypothetical protein AAG906_021353 [Vitis piasezkii]